MRCPPGQYEDLLISLLTRDDLRFGEVDLEVPPVDQETMAPPDVPLFPSGTATRCHPAQLRRCSEREKSIASLKSLVQISVPTSVTELTNALSPGQYEDLSTNLPTRQDLRFGEVDLEVPPVDQETMAPPDVPLFPSGTVVTHLQNVCSIVIHTESCFCTFWS